MSSDELLLAEFKEIDVLWKTEVVNLATLNCSEAEPNNWLECKCLLTSSTVPAKLFFCAKNFARC